LERIIIVVVATTVGSELRRGEKNRDRCAPRTRRRKIENNNITIAVQNRSERTNDNATDTEHTRTRNTTHGTDDCK